MKEKKKEKYIETDDGSIIYYDFCGFENFKSAEELAKGKVGRIIGIGIGFDSLDSADERWLGCLQLKRCLVATI